MPLGIGDISVWEILLRLGSAAILGTLLGLEREAKEKPAGMRTYAMVCLGSSAFMLMGLFVVERFAEQPGVQIDLMRALGGVIGGVGFLGAGAIIHGQGTVKGLTTAAGIWLIAAVGVACGAGAYVIAAITAGLAFIILFLLHLVKRRYFPDHVESPSASDG